MARLLAPRIERWRSISRMPNAIIKGMCFDLTFYICIDSYRTTNCRGTALNASVGSGRAANFIESVSAAIDVEDAIDVDEPNTWLSVCCQTKRLPDHEGGGAKDLGSSGDGPAVGGERLERHSWDDLIGSCRAT